MNDFQKGGIAIMIVVSLLIAASVLAGVYFYLDRQLTNLSTISEVPDEGKLAETEIGDLTEEQPLEDLSQNECPRFGERECVDKESYHICSYDAQNCRKWSPVFSCLKGAECQNGDCVKISLEEKPEESTKIIQCNSGPCCNLATQQFQSTSYICHSKARTEYGCPWGEQTGSNVGVRYQDRYCSGSSAECDGELKWRNWALSKTCSADEKCKNGECAALKCADDTPYGQCSGTKPKYCENGSLIDKCSLCNCPSGQECQTDGKCIGVPIVQCTSGLCCDTLTKTYKAPTYKCQENIVTEYGCPWGEQTGSNVGVRRKDRYCSGSSRDCEGEFKWTNWYIQQECSTDEACSDGQCVSLELCQDDCSSAGLKRCSNNSYQVCGDYDEDSCLEWGSLIGCPSNTVCQNGNCIQQKCADGTTYGQCSTNKPKYCENGSLIDKCSICECPSGQICQTDGSCKIARTFPLVSHFTSENDAVLFSIGFSSLPDNLVAWEANIFEKFIKNYFLDWVQNPQEPNYSIIIEKITSGHLSSINDLCTIDTIIHEYAHFIDKTVSIDSAYAKIPTIDFYSISFDMENPYFHTPSGITFYPVRRPNNIYNEFVTNYAIYGGARPPERNDVFAPWEDFAESFAMYVTHGRVFKELANLDPWMKQKYSWLKTNVFSGREYTTGDIRGVDAVRKILPPSNEILPAQHSCDYSWRISSDFEWNYQF